MILILDAFSSGVTIEEEFTRFGDTPSRHESSRNQLSMDSEANTGVDVKADVNEKNKWKQNEKYNARCRYNRKTIIV